jgi:hypothetical protein
MDVTFADAALAALCNSERRLTWQWGPVAGRTVARRLLELAAVDEQAIRLLPRAWVGTDSAGETIIDFGGGEVIIRGSIANSPPGGLAAADCPGHLVITSVEVHGSEQS